MTTDEENLQRALERSRFEQSQRDSRRLDEAKQLSLLEVSGDARAPDGGGQRQEIVSVPPNFHKFEAQLAAVSRETGTSIRLGPPNQEGLDAFVVLEGSRGGVQVANEKLQALIESARATQGGESPKLLQLLSMGFLREEAERALLELSSIFDGCTCSR